MKRKMLLLSVLLVLLIWGSACGGNTPAKESEHAALVPTLPVIQSSMATISTKVQPDSETEPDTLPAETTTQETTKETTIETTAETTAETTTETKSTAETTTESTAETTTETSTETSAETTIETTAETTIETTAETEAFAASSAQVQSETSTAQTASGLWTPVATLEADWATRAVSEQYYTNADFGFSTYVSPYDRDGDGIEDQADILQGARDYVATRPEYDAGYFETGWPPEGKGVCTDVFNYALLAAGYDMQALMDRDVKLRRWAYDWEVGDNKIDFRRTRNLLVFCDQYLEKLTLDPYDYEAWQPGDIVIFAGRETGMWPGHIAIVSDRRASDGLPYLIHHTDNDRFSYEQDFLTTPQRIIRGHYRVGNLASHGELFE